MKVTDEAVEAALDRWRDHEFDGTLDTPRMRAALTAAAPYMSGVKVKDEGKLLMDVTQAIFPEGWTMSNRNAVADGIRIVLSAIEPEPSLCDQALEEAAKDERIAELETDNKRLREALETIADGDFLFPSEFRFSACAALGEVKL